MLKDWWFVVLSFVILVLGLGLVLGFQLIGLESARSALSTLVQAGGALLGIFFVALGLLWGQANQEEARLKQLQPSYMDLLSPQSPALLSLRQSLADAANDNAFQSSAERMKLLQDCYWRLAVLSYTAILYRGRMVLPRDLLARADDFGIIVKDETERILRSEAFTLTSDEEKFFRYFLDFGNRLSILRQHLKMVGEQEIFTGGIRRAQREDRIGMSLQRIQFFGYFSGRGLKVISLMWLVCLTFGLLILMALDRIPENIMAYLVSIPMAIGFLAIGTTLSLGLRAMRSRE